MNAKLAEVKPAMLPVAEAARYLGISESALRALKRNGDIEFRYLTSHPTVLVADLDALAANAPTQQRSA